MPVLMVATYNEDGSVNVMNAAWGTMQERGKVALNLTESHKTILVWNPATGLLINSGTPVLLPADRRRWMHRLSTNFPFVWSVNLLNIRIMNTDAE